MNLKINLFLIATQTKSDKAQLKLIQIIILYSIIDKIKISNMMP